MSNDRKRIHEMAEIDRACDRFENAIKEGRSPKIEDILAQFEPTLHDRIRKELLEIEESCRYSPGDSEPSSDVLHVAPRTACQSDALVEYENGHIGPAVAGVTSDSTRVHSGHGVSTGDPAVEGVHPFHMPSHLGRYEIQRLLGQGAFGRVWLARDPDLRRQVAIKAPKIGQFVQESLIQSFLDEACRAAGLDHPHIVPVHDVGRTDDGLPFVVSKYVDGVTLRKLLETGAFALDDAIKIVAAISSALHHAHTLGIIHRDVKPANILIDQSGTPFLTDFGLALLVSQQHDYRGEVSGSPAYMSPEQTKGLAHQLDGRADIWSLGVILYEMMTGTRPFRGRNISDLFQEIQTRAPQPPRQRMDAIPEAIETLCLKALSKNMTERFRTALEFGHSLTVAWREAEKVVSQLPHEKVNRNRIISNLPQLPPCYVERAEHLDALRQLLLSRESQTVGVTGAPLLGIQGRGGLGKTVVAAAIAHDLQINERFRDGVVWLTFGQQPAVSALQRQILKRLTGSEAPFETEGDFREQFIRALSDRSLLVVLDDVWQTDHVKDFLVGIPTVCFLLTTRDGKILTQLNAIELGLDALDVATSLTLLSKWAGESTDALTDSEDVVTVLEQTGRLPLAIAVCGAMRRDGHAWSDIAEALKERMYDFLDDDAHYSHRSVLKCLAVGVEFLKQNSPTDADRYLELAVFPSDQLIPEAVVARFWHQAAGLSGLNARKLLTTLHRKNLLTVRDMPESRAIEFHDLQHEYLQVLAEHEKRTAQYHEVLVVSYRDDAVPDWWSVPDDGYFYQNFISHLLAAGRRDQCEDLLFSCDWLQRNLTVRGIRDLVKDLSLFRDSAEVRLLSRAIRLSAHVVIHDASQLYGQLFGRIGAALKERGRDLKVAAAETKSLAPLTQSLTAPGNLLQTLRSPEGAVTAIIAIPGKQQLLTGHWNGAVLLWDIATGNIVRTFSGTDHEVERIVVGKSVDRIFVAAGREIHAWDLETGMRLWKRTCQSSLPVVDINLNDTSAIGVACSGDGSLIVFNAADGTPLRQLDILARPRKQDLQRRKQLVRHSRRQADDEVITPADHDRQEFAVSMKRIQFVPGSAHVLGVAAGWAQCCAKWSDPDSDEAWIINHGCRCTAITIDPANRLVFTSGLDRTIKLWSFENLEQRGVLEGHEARAICLAVSDGGDELASGGRDNAVIVWDLPQKALLARFRGHGAAVRSVCFLHDQQSVASGSQDGSVKIWDLMSVAEVTKHEVAGSSLNPVVRVFASADGSSAFSMRLDGVIEMHDLLTGRCLREVAPHAPVTARDMALSPNGRSLVTVHAGGQYAVFHMSKEGATFECKGEVKCDPQFVEWTPDGSKILISDAESVYVLNATSRERIGLHYAPTRNRPRTPFDASCIVTVRYSTSMRVTSLITGVQHVLGEHADTITDMQISSDGEIVISVGADMLLKVWNRESAVQQGSSMHGHDRIINCCALADDKSLALSGANDGHVVIWNLDTHQAIGRLTIGSSPVVKMTLIDDDNRVVVVSDDGAISLWELSTQTRLGTFTADAQISDLAATSERVIAGDVLGNVHILSIQDHKGT